MTQLSDTEIVAILRLELDQAEGFDADVLADKRARALDYYFGSGDSIRAAGDGRSSIISHDVADTVHSLMAQIGDIFKASAVEFVGNNEEDEKQAQLESDVVRSVLEANDEYRTFDAASFDGLLQGNGWIRVEVLEEEQETTQKYLGLDDAKMLALYQQLNDQFDEYEIVNSDTTSEGENLTIKGTKTFRSLEVAAVSPDRMLFTQAEDQYDLQDLRLVAERRVYTVSELMELGMTEAETAEIPTHTDDYWPAIRAREGGRESNYNDNENEQGGHQEAQQYKETFICYFMLDRDESGIAERHRIHFGGSTMISIEPAYCVPYVTGSPLPVTHRIPGQGMYEVMSQIQDAKTGVLRAYMDNLSVMNQSRVGYLKGFVDVDDLTDSRINGAVGCERPDAIWPLPSNDIGMQAITGLNYLDQVRTARGGAALDMQRGEMQIAETSALAAGLEYSNKEKMAGLYCKNLAQTILKGTFLLVHKIMRVDMQGPLDAKVNGKWVQADPAQWPERKFARVNVGMTSTEKQQKLGALTQLITQQTNFIANGQEGIFTDKGKVYNAICDWIRAADLSANPEEYVTDPESEEAQAAAQQQQQAAQQQQAQLAEMQDQQRELLLMIEKMKDDTARWKTTIETQFKYYDTNVDAGIEEAKQITELSLAGAKQQGEELNGSAGANQ